MLVFAKLKEVPPRIQDSFGHYPVPVMSWPTPAATNLPMDSAVQRFDYDQAGRLTDYSYPHPTGTPEEAISMSVLYAGARPTSISWYYDVDIIGSTPNPTPTPQHELVVVFDSLNRPTAIQLQERSGSGPTPTIAAETTTNFSFDVLDRVVRLKHTYSGGSLEYVIEDGGNEFGYYDREGQIREMTVLENGTPSYQMQYTYDAYGRLMEEKRIKFNPFPFQSWRVQYEYDNSGNRTLRQLERTPGYVQYQSSWTYNDSSDRVATSHYNSFSIDYGYDDRGNVTELTFSSRPVSSDRTYDWDAAGNLWRAKDRYGNVLAEYTYDAFGRRVKKRIVSGGQNVQEIAYHYVGYSLSVAKETERLWETDHWTAWRPRREYLLNGGLAAHIVGVRHYDYSGGGAPVVSLYRYVYDPSGNVAAMLDEDGQMVYVDKNGDIESTSAADNVACRFEYDAYGNNIYPSDDWNKRTAMEKAWATFPHHISTKEWDPEANLYYFGYRWYEPRQGAYVSRTPLGPLQEGTYCYCFEDPVNYFDPNGLQALPITDGGGITTVVEGPDIFIENGILLERLPDGRVIPVEPGISGGMDHTEYFQGTMLGDILDFINFLKFFKSPKRLRQLDNFSCSVLGKAKSPSWYGDHVGHYMKKRGWNEDSIVDTLDKPARTRKTTDHRRCEDGSQMNDDATKFYAEDGSYVVRNDRTGEVFQVSDKFDEGWIDD